ncbi:MAG TPA: C1 family peptidase [Solidesulfovibrio magneticus]|nr:C1 family peptidase [Solidesulfovibrio magneticus]
MPPFAADCFPGHRPGLADLLVFLLLVLALPAGLALAEPVPFGDDDSLETIREKIAQNGYHFTVRENWVTRLPQAERQAMRSRGSRGMGARASRAMAAADNALAVRGDLPAAFDWRNVNGKSSVGPVKDQGTCGACYAFAAAAVAEGVYSVATRRTGADVPDFSEQYIAFCLGTHGSYQAHFDGCEGADYDYAELTALTVEGIITEAALPYAGRDNQTCPQSPAGAVVFSGWGRAGCLDTAAIKSAILTHGPVDAAVYVTSAFDAYDGGVFEDGLTTCPDTYGQGCAYTPTNHAIALVGWDDGDADTPGHFILRNSWGTGWGEDGYMRIAYDAARVACSVSYLTYPAAPAALPALPLLLQ